jgi:hypothetical protein
LITEGSPAGDPIQYAETYKPDRTLLAKQLAPSQRHVQTIANFHRQSNGSIQLGKGRDVTQSTRWPLAPDQGYDKHQASKG